MGGHVIELACILVGHCDSRMARVIHYVPPIGKLV